jgi:hypothetical protein
MEESMYEEIRAMVPSNMFTKPHDPDKLNPDKLKPDSLKSDPAF